jgi:uncharacterized protein YkwD
MRKEGACAVGALALVAALSANAQAGQTSNAWQLRAPAVSQPEARASQASRLSAYESSIVGRINALRGVRGLRPLRVSRLLNVAASYHTAQMGARGFFEHESANGAPFWRRIERFYPSRAYRTWSVGENILWGSPDIGANEAVREWMQSPPHRANLLSREWREIGLGASNFRSAPGTYRGRQVTIVTADFGVRS